MRFTQIKYASDWKSLLPIFFFNQRKKIYHSNLFHPKIISISNSMRKSQPWEYRANEIRIFIFDANKIAFCLFIHLFCARRFFRKYFFCLYCEFFFFAKPQHNGKVTHRSIIAQIPAWFRTEVLFAIIQLFGLVKSASKMCKCWSVNENEKSRRGVAFLLSNIKAEFTHQSPNRDGK